MGGVHIPYASREKVLQTIDRSFHDRSQIRVAFCNAHTMVSALRSQGYIDTLSHFLVLNDGVGLDLASSLFMGHGFEDNLNGTDLVPEILEKASAPVSIYMLGAKQHVVEEAGRQLAARFPRHRIVGMHHGYLKREDEAGVVAKINASGADLLLVAMGNPRQEQFIDRNAADLSPRVLIGVGALFDFISGTVPRAPQWMRMLRLEWLFRLMIEPRRLGWRYTGGLAIFLVEIMRLRVARMWAKPEDLEREEQNLPKRLRPEN
ncbi:WecB/TagA/CpsF family glycosyltransferase [Kaistia soli]|uniref:WecB/TagA/CpsF family glycosyltransferase n=1 Tax=Kaistia soli TaxID=446684 RepID=UPI0009345026|nr:WecB/TagA/CpsF family glycosyltransferase [Kaistia soli]